MRGDSGNLHSALGLTPWKSWVTTPDGRLCLVTGLRTGGLVELRTEASERILLPETDVKRAVHPRNRKPAIEGMPSPRPLCAWCAKKLRPRVNVEWNGSKAIGACLSVGATVTRRFWVAWESYEGVFCTAVCAIRFAGASYRGGFRRVKG